jgi:UDP-glucose 6-dehydrogenase
MSEQGSIGVIGVGWVGVVTATCFAELGHRVIAIDIDAAKVDGLSRGEVPIHEPGIEELLERNRERLRFTTEMAEVLEGAQLLFCCVDTPPTYSGDADLSRVQAVLSELRGDGDHALVMKSTVPAGTGRAIRREAPKLAYVSCPEFLKEGSAVDDFLHPDRVVIGVDGDDGWAADAVEEIYRPLGGELVRTDVASAEMIKLASNAFLATKISFVNEIANVCEEVGADVSEVARGMGLDQRIGPSFLRAGIGYGGSCFAGDESIIVRQGGRGQSISFAELWDRAGGDALAVNGEAIAPHDLDARSWVPGEEEPEWMPVSVLTKRDYDGEMVEVETKDGATLRVTSDHPFLVGDAEDDRILTRVLANELRSSDRIPCVDEHLPGTHGYPPGTDGYRAEIERGGSVQPLASVAQATTAPSSTISWTRVVRVDSQRFRGAVYSLKVPGSQTVVTSGGLVAHQCFPKDVSALKMLAGNTGYHFQLLTAVIEVNELQKRRVMKKLEKHLGSLVGKRVALLGLAFKPDTDDMREATSLVLASRLQGEGASVSGYDPVAERPALELLPRVEFCDSPEQALEGADAAILVTEWPEFAELDWASLAKRMANPLLIDGRNFLDPAKLRAAGFAYEGIGRPNGGGGPPNDAEEDDGGAGSPQL